MSNKWQARNLFGEPFTSEFLKEYELVEKIHFLHRAWRYRLISEKFGVSFLLNSNLSGLTALDIGANRGIFSYWMHKKVGSNGKVIVFEPQPELNQELHALRNAFSLPRLEIAKVGLSSVTQKMKMYRPKTHWGGASVETGANDKSREAFEVEVRTLDSLQITLDIPIFSIVT